MYKNELRPDSFCFENNSVYNTRKFHNHIYNNKLIALNRVGLVGNSGINQTTSSHSPVPIIMWYFNFEALLRCFFLFLFFLIDEVRDYFFFSSVWNF